MKSYLLYSISKFIICLFIIQSSLCFSQSNTFEKNDQKVKKETSVNNTDSNSDQKNDKTAKQEEWLPRTPSRGTNPEQFNNNSSWMFLKSFFILLIFLILIYLVFRWVQKRKILASNNQNDAVIQVLNTTSLTANKSIQLVEIGGYLYILGLGDNISLINRIEDPREIEELKKVCHSNLENRPAKNFNQIFGSYFSTWSKKETKKTEVANKTLNHFQFFNDRKNKLKSLKNNF